MRDPDEGQGRNPDEGQLLQVKVAGMGLVWSYIEEGRGGIKGAV